MSKQRACVEVSCGDQQEQGYSIAVYTGPSEECTHRLRRPRAMRNPSIIVQSTENTVTHADGSSEFPLELPGLEQYNGKSVGEILVRMPSGQIRAWSLSSLNGRKKLILEAGSLKLVDDYLSDLFEGEICSGTCGDVDYALGVKQIIDECVGEPTKTRWQIVRIPKCCCAEAEEAGACTAHPAVDAALEAGYIETGL